MSDLVTGQEHQGGNAAAITPRAVDMARGWSWITEAWALFAKQPVVWMLVIFLSFVISFICAVVIIIGWIAACLMAPVFVGGLMLGSRALQRGENFEVSHLFAGFTTGTRELLMLGAIVLVSMIACTIILTVVALVGGAGAAFASFTGDVESTFAAVMGFLVVFLVGTLISLLVLIPVTMALWFAPALIVFRGIAAADAMRLSFQACLRNIFPFLIYSLAALAVFVVILIVPHMIPLIGSLAGFLLSLVFWSVIYASIYTGYRDIFADT
jgi:hypothetical protein